MFYCLDLLVLLLGLDEAEETSTSGTSTDDLIKDNQVM